MNRKSYLYFSILVGIPVLIYLVGISLYSSPFIQGTNLSNDFKHYYLAYAKGDTTREQHYKRKIYDIVEHRLRPNPDDPLAKFIWIGMFSGNEDIALISGTVHFSYLRQNRIALDIIIILSALLYVPGFLVSVNGICHNVFTFIFRFHKSQNRAFLKYFVNLSKELNADYSGNIPQSGGMKALFAFFPGWLIGLLIGYYDGGYDLYLQNPVVPIAFFSVAHLFCACAGGILVSIFQQLIGFILMRFDIDIISSYVDDIIAAVLGISISTIVFTNSIGTTLSVTLGILLFTVVKNSTLRLRNKYIWDIEEPCAENRTYENIEYGFSFIIPAGWVKRKLPREFSTTGGQIQITHQHGRASFNVSVGLLDPPEWKDKEIRARALYSYLSGASGDNREIHVDTKKGVGGATNAIVAEYIKNWPIPGIKLIAKGGLISIFHNGLDYAIQWHALPDFEAAVRSIISSFKFKS